MLQMITAQWKELQKQIRRQHGWIMGALDTIKADILQKDEFPEVVSESQVRQKRLYTGLLSVQLLLASWYNWVPG